MAANLAPGNVDERAPEAAAIPKTSSGERPRLAAPSRTDATDDDTDRFPSSHEIERLLHETGLWLYRLMPGPLSRELDLSLERHRRAARDWSQRSQLQKLALLQGIHLLRRTIVDALSRR